MSKKLINLVEAIFTAHDEEISCADCDAEVAHLAELVEAGGNAAALLPAVYEHLQRCGDCREEFEALVAVLHAENLNLFADQNVGE